MVGLCVIRSGPCCKRIMCAGLQNMERFSACNGPHSMRDQRVRFRSARARKWLCEDVQERLGKKKETNHRQLYSAAKKSKKRNNHFVLLFSARARVQKSPDPGSPARSENKSHHGRQV